MFDRFCMNKAQQEVESQRKREDKRQQLEDNSVQYIVARDFTVRLIEGRKMCLGKLPFKSSLFTF